MQQILDKGKFHLFEIRKSCLLEFTFSKFNCILCNFHRVLSTALQEFFPWLCIFLIFFTNNWSSGIFLPNLSLTLKFVGNSKRPLKILFTSLLECLQNIPSLCNDNLYVSHATYSKFGFNSFEFNLYFFTFIRLKVS